MEETNYAQLSDPRHGQSPVKSLVQIWALFNFTEFHTE